MTGWALLPDSWGGALWRIFNGLLYAAGLSAWARRALPEGCSPSQRMALFLLVLPLSVHSMHNGQANVVMLAALLLGLTAASAENWNRAAGWFAFAALIKGYPLALGLLPEQSLQQGGCALRLLEPGARHIGRQPVAMARDGPADAVRP